VPQLRVGVIGLGVGAKHIQAYQAHPECRVTAICDFSSERLQNSLRLCPDAKTTKNADEILNAPDIDVVSVASFDNHHHEQVVRAIRNKKHVFVEKPICLFADEAREIKRLLLEKPDIRLSSNLNLRTCPRFMKIKDAVGRDELGKVYYLEGDYFWGRPHKLRNGWRKEMPFYSIIHGAAVHMIDLVLWIVNQRPVEVQGYGNRIATGDSGMRFNDFASLLLKFEGGEIAKITANGGCVYPHFHRLTVYGSEKSFVHEISGGNWFEHKDAQLVERPILEAYPSVEDKGKVITSFIDLILTDSESEIVSSKDVFDTLSVCFSAEKAIESGRTTKIEYL